MPGIGFVILLLGFLAWITQFVLLANGCTWDQVNFSKNLNIIGYLLAAMGATILMILETYFVQNVIHIIVLIGSLFSM